MIPSTTAPARVGTSVSPDAHPWTATRDSPYTTRQRPAAVSRNPPQSNFPADGSVALRRHFQAKIQMAMPTGTLIQKIHRQLASVVRIPPNTGPSAGPSTPGTVSTEAARARSFGGYARKSMAEPTGVIMPPPTPWSTRKATSCSMDCAAPQRAEPIVKVARAKRNTRLVPIRSPTQPENGVHTARLSA